MPSLFASYLRPIQQGIESAPYHALDSQVEVFDPDIEKSGTQSLTPLDPFQVLAERKHAIAIDVELTE